MFMPGRKVEFVKENDLIRKTCFWEIFLGCVTWFFLRQHFEFRVSGILRLIGKLLKKLFYVKCCFDIHNRLMSSFKTLFTKYFFLLFQETFRSTNHENIEKEAWWKLARLWLDLRWRKSKVNLRSKERR